METYIYPWEREPYENRVFDWKTIKRVLLDDNTFYFAFDDWTTASITSFCWAECKKDIEMTPRQKYSLHIISRQEYEETEKIELIEKQKREEEKQRMQYEFLKKKFENK